MRDERGGLERIPVGLMESPGGEAVLALDRSGSVLARNAQAVDLLGEQIPAATSATLRSLVAGRRPFKRRTRTRRVWLEAEGGAGIEASASERSVVVGGSTIHLVTLADAGPLRSLQRIVEGERAVLAAVADGAPPPDVFDIVIGSIEASIPGSFASILVASPDGTSLHLAAAGAMPDAFSHMLAGGIPIGPAAPPCGQAAFWKRRIVVADAETDRRLDDPLRASILRLGLASCWSDPVLSARGEVLGTLAVYRRRPGEPDLEDADIVRRAGDLVAMVMERHRAEEIGGEAEYRYRTLASMTKDFAYRFTIHDDGRATLEWVTDAFESITGYPGSEWEAIGGWAGLIHPDEVLAFSQRLPRVLAGEEVSGDFRVVTRSGDVRWLSITTKPVEDPLSGRVVAMTGVAHDFTARKEAEDAKTMFLATASHELKTPLTVIRGFAQILSDGRHDGVGSEAAQTIERRAIQLNKIVDRILLSSRIETGRASISVHPVDPVPILDELTTALATATGREVAFEPLPLPAVLADADGFATVIDHLLDNAVKYSPDGGPVTVAATADASAVSIVIRDHGVGMTPEQVSRCFEKFWQAESSDVRRFGGTGIGLYIVRSLVESMGGTVSVESIHGEGSVFSIALARADATADEADGSQTPGVGERSVIREFMRQLGIPSRSEP